MMLTGYDHPAYCHALAEFGTPTHLANANGWLLTRDVPGAQARDAMGCYPLFTCAQWDALPDDLERLRNEIVSVILVTDPFGNYDHETLRAYFDLLAPFKEHLVVDLTRSPDTFVAPHHQRNVKKAAKLVDVEVCADPMAYAADWIDLYGNLVARHGIRGIARFSRFSLAQQLQVPGAVMLRAVRDGATAGMLIWYQHADVAYYHLGAYSDAGYQARASFALFDAAMRHFRGRVPWLALGAGAGANASGDDGLTRFKSGWATGVRPTYLAGRILDTHRYEALVTSRGVPPVSYFPRYRAGEFA